MRTAQQLMLAYLAGTAEETGALFSPEGTLELPYLASIGLPPVLKGPAEIAKFLGFLHGTLYPEFKFQNVKVLIDGGTQVFAEYQINHKSGISGKFVNQQFFGHLEAESENPPPPGSDRRGRGCGSHLPERTKRCNRQAVLSAVSRGNNLHDTDPGSC